MSAQDNGFTTGGIYVATSESFGFTEGSLVMLEAGVERELPLFKLIEGWCEYKNAAGGKDGAYDMYWHFRPPTFEEFGRAVALIRRASETEVNTDTTTDEETTTMANSPLTRAGFKVGDVLRATNNRGRFKAGDTVRVLRDDGDALPLVENTEGTVIGYYRVEYLAKQEEPENADNGVKLEPVALGGSVKQGDALVLTDGTVVHVDMDMAGPDSDGEYSVMGADRGYVKVDEIKSAYRVASTKPPKTEKTVELTLSVAEQDLIETLESKLFTPSESFEASYRRLTDREQILLAHLVRELKETL